MKYFAFFIALTFALRTSVGRTSSLTKKRPSIYEKQLPTRPLPPTHRRHHDLPLDGNGPSNFNISTTTNWAGATIDMPRASANQTDLPAIGSVKAQWNIPRLCLREGQNTSSAGTLQTWIGVSGKACEPKGAMVQAGIRAVLQGDGSTAASAWASWYPAISYMNIYGFDVRPGDVVTVVLMVYNTTGGLIQFANRRTNQLVTRTIYSPDPSVGDFSICGDGDGRAWAVVEGAFTWERDPPDTATDVDGIPVFEDISFRTLEVLGRREMRDLHDDSAVLYVVADDQGVAVNVDTLGDNGFQLYTSETCANDARDHV